MKSTFIVFFGLLLAGIPAAGGCARDGTPVETIRPLRTPEQVEDYRKQGILPERIDRIYCSGGTLRLIVYLECADRVVAVDSNEKYSKDGGMKPYLAAHPGFLELPLGGETSGRDNPELLLSLERPPQLIIKADTQSGYDPEELSRRTGIPVLMIPMRGLTTGRDEFDAGIRLLGCALGKEDRAEKLLAYFDGEIAAIQERADRARSKAESAGRTPPTVYAGGVSYGGSHAFCSTEAGYPPFEIARAEAFLKADEDNVLLGKRHTMLGKEKILEWDPDILFLDLGTLALGESGGLAELRRDPAYRSLDAIGKGNVYALLPNTFYFVNHDAVLANAWFVGKTLYPEEFEDIDPKKKADAIFTFLLGRPVFEQLNADLRHLVFERLPLN